jgi:DNA invertase Pin-like site-specific DNA recombinase
MSRRRRHRVVHCLSENGSRSFARGSGTVLAIGAAPADEQMAAIERLKGLGIPMEALNAALDEDAAIRAAMLLELSKELDARAWDRHIARNPPSGRVLRQLMHAIRMEAEGDTAAKRANRLNEGKRAEASKESETAHKLKASGMKPKQIASELGISLASVYRRLKGN